MQNKLILTSLLLLLSLYANAQPSVSMDYSGVKRDTIPMQIFDQAKLQIFYDLTIALSKKGENKAVVVPMLTQRGRKYSQSIDYEYLRHDSTYNANMRSDMPMQKVIATTFVTINRIRNETVILKNYPKKGGCTYQNHIGSTNYRYENDVRDLVWSLQNQTKEIAGYTCKKATCNFRGRRYIAWYTPDIPIPDGPYVFSGLPGLILEIYDDHKHYCFTFKGMRKVDGWRPIYLRANNVVEIDREHFREMTANMRKDPCATFKAYNEPCPEEVRRKNEKPEPYNPIELW